MAPTAPFALDRQTILWVDEQTDRQTDLYLEVDKQMDRQTDLYFEVDEQTDRQTAGQTELRNYYIDSKNTGAWKGKLKRFFVNPKAVEMAKNGTNII